MRSLPRVYTAGICHLHVSSKTCPAQRQVSFASCLIERPRFVATKKMTLLSGNPDGFSAKKDKKRATD
jgi:hypothetical protein